MEGKFNYELMKLESIPCNLCGKDSFFVLADKAGGRKKVQTCLCRNCGLIYINPRMTMEDYDDYYKNHYRQDRYLLKGKKDTGSDLEKNFENARRFGAALANKLSGFIKPGITLDVGSSTGGILFGLKEKRADLEIVGIEPSADESEFANKKGVKTYRALFEDFHENIGSFSNILCAQSLNHLLNPGSFFLWSREHLQDGGNLILSVKNFRQQVRRAGALSSAVQIDHPYMFVPETLRLLLEVSGFKIVFESIDENKSKQKIAVQKAEGLPGQHILIVAKKDPDAAIHTVPMSRPDIYRKLRIQLFRPYLKAYNLVFYRF